MAVPTPTLEYRDDGLRAGSVALRWTWGGTEHGVEQQWAMTGGVTHREPLVAMQRCLTEFVNWCNREVVA